MNTYNVEIKETLIKTVGIEAKNQNEAEEIAERNWRNSEYILDADNFDGVEFHAASHMKNRDMER